MSDVVERLRSRWWPLKANYDERFLDTQAANEIERLRAALNDIVQLDHKHLTGRQKIDRAITLAKQAIARPPQLSGKA